MNKWFEKKEKAKHPSANVRFTYEEHKQLKSIAKSEDTTISEVIREFTKFGMKRYMIDINVLQETNSESI